MSGGSLAPYGAMPVVSATQPGLLPDGELERILLASQEDVTLLCCPETIIHYASPSVRTLLGYAPEDVVGHSFADFIHPDDLPALADEWQKFNSGTDGDPVQYRTRRKDGSWGWFEARAGRIDDHRLPGFSCVTISKVDHIYKLRSRVTAAEAMAKVGSWRWIIKDGEPFWTDSMYRLLGYEPETGPVDLDWAFGLIHPDEQDQFRSLIMEGLESSRSFTTTLRMWAKNERYKSIIHYCYTEHDAGGEVVAMIGICQDITAQTQAEQALRASERAYRMLAEEASDVIFRVSVDGRCNFASPACYTTLGYKPGQMIGRAILRFAHKSDHANIQAVYERARRGSDSQRVVFRGEHKDGGVVWLEAGVRPIINADGECAELVIVARDITERRQYEEELRRAREKAESANVSKSKFLANMSHELRTPLNGILGFSDIMREEMFGPLGSEQYTDYVRLIHESGQFLLDLINDILDISKIEAGKYELFIEGIDLEEMIEGCFRIVETRATGRGVTLNREVPADLPKIPADERALKQILLNLLSNAVKFTEKDGSVKIDVKHHGDIISVSVADTGCGIPAADIPRLAQPFEQVTSEARFAQKGTGLGLALVKSFVEMHGGTLSIDSIEGEGTTVTFTLPLKTQPQKKSA